MKINLAIYTATEGFDWQPGSAYPRGELNKYKEMIGRFPDILMEKVPYGGIFVCDGKLVFYRLHIAQRGDSRGRDALYCVLGTIPLEAGKKVNLSRVFETPEFRAPMRPFPNSVEIEESLPARPPSTWEEMQDALNSPSSSAQVGVLATFFSHGRFFCRLDGSVDNPTPQLTYENCDLKPAPKVDVRPPIEVVRAEVAAQPNTAAIERNAYDRARSDFEKRLMAKELDNRRIESENQSLKNIVVILAVILSVLVVAGVGALLFSCCFSSSQKPVQVEEPKNLNPVDLESGSDIQQPDKKMSDRGKSDKKDGGQGQKPSKVADNMEPTEQRAKEMQKAVEEQVGDYDPPTTEQKLPLNKANQKKDNLGQVTGSPETNKPPVKVVTKGREVVNHQGIDPARKNQVGHRDVAKCAACDGCGKVVITDRCPVCKGFGYIWCYEKCRSREHIERDDLDGFLFCAQCRTKRMAQLPCGNCHGQGRIKVTRDCNQCSGNELIP